MLISFFVVASYPIIVKFVSNFFSLLLSIEPLLPTFIDRVGWKDSSIRLKPKAFDGFKKDYFLSSLKLKPKPRLFVETLSPGPATESFLFSGGLIFLIEV
jgi:hypothetical protein